MEEAYIICAKETSPRADLVRYFLGPHQNNSASTENDQLQQQQEGCSGTLPVIEDPFQVRPATCPLASGPKASV